MTNVCMVIAIVAYLLLVLYVGYMFSKKNESTEDFYLGGRKMGPLVTAMSAEASDMSSWLLMGLPGVAYLTGICDAAWTAIGLAIGTWLNWFFVSKRLRRYSSKVGAITVPDFFAKRFHDKSNIITAFSALIIIVFFVPYTASGFAACGKLFHSLFGVDYHFAMIVSAVIIVLYTIMGGFSAVCTTDFIQSIVMSIALISVLGFGVVTAGGVNAVVDNTKNLAGYISMTSLHSAGEGTAKAYGPITVVSTMAWGLGYFGMPHILVRFMAIKDEKKLSLSRRVASVWVVISMAVGVLIGIVGLAMTKVGAVEDLTASSSDSETIIVKITGLIAKNGVFAALLAGLILAGILAATMSTSDSQMLAAASSVSQNIFQDFFHIKLSTKQALLVARITVVIVAAFSVFLARNQNSSVFQIVSFAWAGFGGAFGAVMLLSLFWKRCNLPGALAGMISGGATIFIWKFAIRPLGGIVDIYELLPAFVVSLFCTVTVSLCTKAPEQSIIDEFNEVSDMNCVIDTSEEEVA